MKPQLAREMVSIVLRGPFSPVLFHPSWFAAHNLIREQEAESAEVEIIHPSIAEFRAEWLEVQVVADRFQVATQQESFYEVLRDMVAGVLGILSPFNLRAMGINRQFQYQLESERAWHALGDALAPKDAWRNVLDTPGMAGLVMQGKRTDSLDGYIQVRVEPSREIAYGVFMEVNDHYQLSEHSKNGRSASNLAITCLLEQWQTSMERSLHIVERIINLGDM
ncbi:MAG: hypothetical protein GXP42_09425 [Chloroflexi bacterium]|nr:hypothetical protein [Chloroflexota bacterium]